MEAVIASGGKQYRVKEGQVIRVERLPGEKGATVEFREVRYLKGEGEPIVDAGRLTKARVLGQVLTQGKARKVLVVKFKRRKNYRRRKGHRQAFTAVRITKIEVA
ncbi:MAG: 50S ribosomal protein L21 [Candidatus Rokubacteria bacterium]|nr:50S ribosomal protein L21 [Candidatus Rokubacteria bacterium]MBI2878566.1 50S ribosomal protein L21 [Candidatus Rokubacteria bacterium]